MIGDKGMFGGVCVDIIHTEEYGDIEIYSQNDFAYIPPFMKTAYTPIEWEKEMNQCECFHKDGGHKGGEVEIKKR